MALKPRLIRRWRKEILRCGTITRTEILNKDEDGTVYSDRKDWGYVVECTVNGYSIGSYGQNWYEAWQGAVYSARWAKEQEEFHERYMRKFDEFRSAKLQAEDDTVRKALMQTLSEQNVVRIDGEPLHVFGSKPDLSPM